MADEKEEVTEVTEQPAPVEEVNEDAEYEKELEVATKKLQAQKGYEQRKKEKTEDPDLAEQVAEKLFPKLQAQNEQVVLGQRLEALSKGNEKLKELIKFHLENSVNPNLDLESRLDIAYAAANKKHIERTAKELNIAQQNRSQIASASSGSSTEVQKKPGNNVVSDDQLKDLKARAEKIGTAAGWSPERKQKFVEDTIKNLAGRS